MLKSHDTWSLFTTTCGQNCLQAKLKQHAGTQVRQSKQKFDSHEPNTQILNFNTVLKQLLWYHNWYHPYLCLNNVGSKFCRIWTSQELPGWRFSCKKTCLFEWNSLAKVTDIWLLSRSFCSYLSFSVMAWNAEVWETGASIISGMAPICIFGRRPVADFF